MTDQEAQLKLALARLHKVVQRPAAAEIKSSRLVGAAILCTWAAADLLGEAASLKQIRETLLPR